MHTSYEHRTHPLATRRQFTRRVAHHGAVGIAIIGASLAIGTLGDRLHAQ